jgi:hypothetical protein
MDEQQSEIRIQVDKDKLGDWSLDDLEELEGSGSIKAMMSLLDTVVVGGVRGRGFKVKDLKRIQDALFAEVAKLGNPVDTSGKA